MGVAFRLQFNLQRAILMLLVLNAGELERSTSVWCPTTLAWLTRIKAA